MGTLTPAIWPTCRAHMPAQFTTASQRTLPSSVSTATTTPFSTSKPSTRFLVEIATPFARAPRAMAWVSIDGSQ